MHLLRLGPAGSERPAVRAGDGAVYDLSSLTADIDGDFLAADGTARARAAADGGRLDRLDTGRAPRRAAGRPARRGRLHRAELRRARRRVRRSGRPSTPIVFFKHPNTVVGAVRRRPHPARRDADRLGGRAGRRHRAAGPLPRVARGGARRASPATASPTTSPSATSSSSTRAASGRRASAARPSTRSARGWCRPTRSRPAGARPAVVGQRRAAPGLDHRGHDLRRRTTWSGTCRSTWCSTPAT